MSVRANTYPATPTWNFICENYALSGNVKVQIAKTEKGGLLKLIVETTDPSFIIAGNVYVDLADTTVIICTDKNNRETNGNQIISYYNFVSAEMNRLKKSDIQSIRFSIKGKKEKFASQTGYFTAINKKSYFSTVYSTDLKSYATTDEIQLLFSN
jgi:hypothetical protein